MIARVLVAVAATCLLAGCATRRDNASSTQAADAAPALDFDPQRDAKTRVGRVERVEAGETADWVLLDAGYERNVSPGMKITVRRQGKAIATLVVAETTAQAAAALILELTPNQTVQPGDSAHITTN